MKHGDFIKIDFIGRVAETKVIFDFTQEEVAKREGLHNPKHQYAPALVIIGAKMVIPGVEKHLLKMKPGEEKEFSVPSQEAFGKRNLKLMKVFSLSNFLRQNINPTPGSFVDIDGMRGKVQSVSGGRVRVDFNHPLAGKELKYWVKMTDVIKKPEDKVAALFSWYSLPYSPHVKDNTLTIEGEKPVPHEARQFIEESVGKWIKEIKKIQFPEKKSKK